PVTVMKRSELRTRLHGSPIAELDLIHHPPAARRATSQRRHLCFDLVTGADRLSRPAITRQGAGTDPFKDPGLGRAVLLLDVHDDEDVRSRITEFLYDALE